MPFESAFAKDIYREKYSMDKKESWEDTCARVATAVIPDTDTLLQTDIFAAMKRRYFIPGGRYLYSAGRPKNMVCNCFVAKAEDTRESWAHICSYVAEILMTGGGIGVDYTNVRHEGAYIKGNGGTATGPIALMRMVNEIGRNVMMGGTRRSAIIALLRWSHPDVHKFMTLKDWPEHLRALKAQDLTHPMDMELTNISVSYDRSWWRAVDSGDINAWQIFVKNVAQMVRTSEPGCSFDPYNDEHLRNPCGELTSDKHGDKCNLGTVWMNHVPDLSNFKQVVADATRMLIYGNLYTFYPNELSKEVGLSQNRIGLGLGGIHEWLMQRGYRYEMNRELQEWLWAYHDVSNETAYKHCNFLGIPLCKGIRAIAPTGTIGILAESTTGIEPLFCKAYKRRYFDAKQNVWLAQYVVDGAVKRLTDRGIPVSKIQDAYDLTFEDRVEFQADVQDFVDMAISSTCNMPAWGSEQNNESTVDNYAKTLYKYSKRLRGFTCYADGSRGGQPLTRVALEDAIGKEGQVFEQRMDECVGGVCGV